MCGDLNFWILFIEKEIILIYEVVGVKLKIRFVLFYYLNL